MGISNKLTLKIKHVTFLMIWSILKTLIQGYWNRLSYKSHTKILVFTTLDTLQLKKVNDYENIHSVNPLYLMIGKVIGHVEESNENKYLIFDSTDENKEVLKKYTEPWDVIKNKIEITNDGECKYGKDFTKIKFDTDDGLPLNKPLNLCMLTIVVRFVFEDEGIFYPQVYFDECFYEL